MDLRSKSERVVEASYSLHRTQTPIATGDAEYATFRADSYLAVNPTRGTFERDALVKLFALYLNSTLIAVNKPLVRGGKWDYDARTLSAFARMRDYFNEEYVSASEEENQRGITRSFAPPEHPLTGIGASVINETPVELSTIANVIQLKLNIPNERQILDFNGIFGYATIRFCRYYWSLTPHAADGARPDHGFAAELGQVELRISDAMDTFRYIPMGGDALRIMDGVRFPIRGGVLTCTGVIRGLYQMEFDGLWGTGHLAPRWAP